MQLDLETRDRLRQTGKGHLHAGTFRSGLTGDGLLPKPFAGQPKHLRFDPQPHQLVVHRRVAQRGLVSPGRGDLADDRRPRAERPEREPIATRSLFSVVVATRQPPPSGPRRFASGTRMSVRKTSLNSASPVIWRSGRMSTPGCVMSTQEVRQASVFGYRRVGARDQDGHLRVLRHRRPHLLAVDNPVIGVMPSRTARVAAAARSDPAPGSLNNWQYRCSPVNNGRRNFRFCSSVPKADDRRRRHADPDDVLTCRPPGAPAAASLASNCA